MKTYRYILIRGLLSKDEINELNDYAEHNEVFSVCNPGVYTLPLGNFLNCNTEIKRQFCQNSEYARKIWIDLKRTLQRQGSLTLNSQ